MNLSPEQMARLIAEDELHNARLDATPSAASSAHALAQHATPKEAEGRLGDSQ